MGSTTQTPGRALNVAAALFAQHCVLREAFSDQRLDQLFNVAVRLADHIL